ncbi:DNA topoisomerase IV subunit A [Trinickia symbiotica]|uniref:DNA topoisomerase 4 subunit A n=1 Tax=Trinickia symbiotica TaxID=863227 RepID=A0A2N7X396_9BURK|nr:DNA topoisomerase IV subunit A [Trinickia symbiotica]PMS36061.1 DNA topoisomerase IV subunit A [Trinickia symbiotica]PPK45737.1 DNA topoisomerase IV subunit A [Trinickia symbiotica]
MAQQDDLFAPAVVPDGESLTLGHYAERAYLDYAVSVVKGRALPDVSDGQKPVQRRILYAMNEMGLAADAKPVKSARVVGDVLGKYHPHGDQSAYDALVRLAQDFSMRYPLIDGQGNFGSRDGDGAAAMRYTEARLTPIARLLLDEIDEGTVDFMPNYDGSFQEPKLLPARLPFLLLNGASGIAVGLATEIPSHNLREVAAAAVAMIRHPNISHAELMDHLPGPDFPGGGQIISSPAEIAAAYETGRGSLKVRARWKIEELARGQWQLVVTELPPNTSGQKVLEEIEELTNPKVKLGKKTLTPEQLTLKQTVLALVDTVRDESGKDAPVRLVFEPKTSRIDQTEFANSLLAHTSLESNAPLNLVMIGGDGRPKQKGLTEILREWVGFRFATVTRRTRHRLTKVDDRIHILEGRMIVFLNLDEVIRIIRESEEPKQALIAAFGLSDRQAEDILEIRLRQLARLEKIKIEKELQSLRDEKAKLEELLASDTVMKRQIIKEIEADAKQYGDERRTLIQQEKRATFEARVVDEPVTVVVSQRGWVRALKGHGLDPAGFSFKDGDSLYAAFQCRTPDTLIAWGSSGRVYSVAVAMLPGGRGDGVPVTSLIELEAGTHLLHYYAANAEQPLLLASSNGFGFIARVSDMVSRVKAGKSFMTIDAGAAPLAPMPVVPDAVQVACLSSSGRLLVFGIDEMKTLTGGGRGITLMMLDEKETLVQALAFGAAGLMLLGTGRGGKPQEETFAGAALEPHVGKRARRGRAPDTRLKVSALRPALG